MRKIFALLLIVVILVALTVAALSVQNRFEAFQSQISELEVRNSSLQNQTAELQAQVSELQNQNNVLQDRLDGKYGDSNVQIGAVTLTGFSPIVYVEIQSTVSVTVINNNFIEVNGLVLIVRLVNNNNTDVGTGYTMQIGKLGPGENRTFSGGVIWNLSVYPFVVVSEIRLGTMVVAEKVGTTG